MSNLVRLDPFGELLAMQRRLDRVLAHPFSTTEAEAGETALDMYETDEAVVVKVAVPGYKPDDVQITLTGDTLTIKGEIKTEQENRDEKRNYLWREIRHSSFQRTVTLPSGAKGDDTKAEFENGELVLTIPKSEETKPRTIQVKAK